MRLIPLVVALAITAPSVAHAQPDRVLLAIQNKLPQGWQMAVRANRVVIDRVERVWSLYGNRINAPGGTEPPGQRVSRIKQHGKRVRLSIQFRSTKRWSPAKYKQARRHNARIHGKLRRLQRDSDATHRRLRLAKPRGKRMHGNTPAEQAAVQRHRARAAALRSRLITLPTCNTSRRSLFEEQATGVADGFHEIYPSSSQAELHAVRRALQATCK